MNERFQQLLEKSTNPPWDGEQGPMNEFNLERFAQLIVRECAKKGFDIFDEEPDAPASDLQFYVHNRILQHFGIE